MGSSSKGGGGGGGGRAVKPPTVIPHTTSAPMTAAIKKNPVEEFLGTRGMNAPQLFVPGKDGGPALPQPYEYKTGRDQLAKSMKKKYNYRDTWQTTNRASNSHGGGTGWQ